MNPTNQSNPKVLMLLTNAFDPDPRVHQEARSLVQNGYNVTVLCWDRDYKESPYDMIDGIRIERIYVRSTHGRGSSQIFFLLKFWLKAYVKACSKDFDIVHCHDFDTLPLGYMLSRQKGPKLVYDAHESYADMLVNVPFWFKRLLSRFETLLIAHVHLLITVGEILRKDFRMRGAKNTCVVGNWKDPDLFMFSPKILEQKKKRLGISKKHFVISFIAFLTKERQIPQLIDSVKDMPNVFLLLGGYGPCQELAEKASRRYPNVAYLGYVNPDSIPLYTALSDAVFYGFDSEIPNSKYSAPNKLFEALAAGKPIITGDFGEIALIVKQYKCGVVLRDYSKGEIQAAIEALSFRGNLSYGMNALKVARTKYNWTFAESTLLASYNSLYIKNPGPRASALK